MTVVLPPLPLTGTYAQRIAYSSALITPGQSWFQTNSYFDASVTAPSGYYYWRNGWVYDTTQASGGVDYDGRGQNIGSGGAVRVNNSDDGTTWIDANPTGFDAFKGLWDRTVGGRGVVYGLFISKLFRTSLRTKRGQVLGLWSTDPANGNTTRLLDLSHDQNGDNRVRAALRYGDGSNFGQIPAHAFVDLSEPSNSGASETDALIGVLPANSLLTPNQAIDIYAWGVCAPNTNTKRARLAFGSTVIANTTAIAANGLGWRIHAKVYATGPAAQKFFGEALFATNGMQMLGGTASETMTAPINIAVKLTGQQTGDITLKGFEAMVYN